MRETVVKEMATGDLEYNLKLLFSLGFCPEHFGVSAFKGFSAKIRALISN
jgi:hypothetical protein